MNGNGITGVSSLTTSGAVTVGGVLNVTGNFTVASTKFSVAAASGNTQVAGALNVLGSTVLSGDLFVGAVITASATTGNITTTGKLTVDGAATFTTTAKVTGATTLSSTLAVTGAAAFGATGSFTGTLTAANGTSGFQVVNYSQFPQATVGTVYIGFPGAVGSGVGVYDQGGSGTSGLLGAAVVTFPKVFPTDCKSIVITPFNASGTAYFATITALSATQANIQIRDSSGTGTSGVVFYWRAVGY